MFRKLCTRRLSSQRFKESYGFFAGGLEVPHERSFPVFCPFDGRLLTRVADTDADTASKVIENAHKAFESGIWSRSDVRERSRVLTSIAGLLRTNIPRLAELEVYQTGRSIREMNVSYWSSACTL